MYVYLLHSFSDFVVYLVTNLIFPKNRRQMCQFFDKRGYPVSVVQVGDHRAQHYKQLRRALHYITALQTAEKEKTDRIPFTLIFRPHNHADKSIILKNSK